MNQAGITTTHTSSGMDPTAAIHPFLEHSIPELTSIHPSLSILYPPPPHQQSSSPSLSSLSPTSTSLKPPHTTQTFLTQDSNERGIEYFKEKYLLHNQTNEKENALSIIPYINDKSSTTSTLGLVDNSKNDEHTRIHEKLHELYQVDTALQEMKHHYSLRMKHVSQGIQQFYKKQQHTIEVIQKLRTHIIDTYTKRKRAEQRIEEEKTLYKEKLRESETVQLQLSDLQSKRSKLIGKVDSYKYYKLYLESVLLCTEQYHDIDELLVRYNILRQTTSDLTYQAESLQNDIERVQQEYVNLQKNGENQILLCNSMLSSLLSKSEKIQNHISIIASDVDLDEIRQQDVERLYSEIMMSIRNIYTRIMTSKEMMMKQHRGGAGGGSNSNTRRHRSHHHNNANHQHTAMTPNSKHLASSSSERDRATHPLTINTSNLMQSVNDASPLRLQLSSWGGGGDGTITQRTDESFTSSTHIPGFSIVINSDVDSGSVNNHSMTTFSSPVDTHRTLDTNGMVSGSNNNHENQAHGQGHGHTSNAGHTHTKSTKKSSSAVNNSKELDIAFQHHESVEMQYKSLHDLLCAIGERLEDLGYIVEQTNGPGTIQQLHKMRNGNVSTLMTHTHSNKQRDRERDVHGSHGHGHEKPHHSLSHAPANSMNSRLSISQTSMSGSHGKMSSLHS